MGDINASVPQVQLPDYTGTVAQAALIQPRNALLRAQTADTAQDAKQKAYTFSANAIGSSLYGVLQAPPEQQEGEYQNAKAQLRASGIDTSAMPPNFDPDYVKGAMVKALGVMQTYQLGLQRGVVGALGGPGVNASLPPAPGQAPPAAAPASPTVPAPAAPPPRNSLNNLPPSPGPTTATPAPTTIPTRATTSIPGAGPALALTYLMDPAAGAGALKEQLSPYDLRPGGVHVNPATGEVVQNPYLPAGERYDFDTGTADLVPGAVTGAEAMKGAEGLGSKRGELGGEYEGHVRDDAQGAVAHNALLGQMKQQLAGITSFDPGTYGSLKGKFSKLFASVLGDNDSATNFQEFQKNSVQLALQQARSLSPREAFQGVLFVQQGNPNFDMTRAGINGVIGQMQGLDQYKMAKMQALSQWTGDPNKFEAYWQKATDPTVFMFANASPAQQQQMLSGLSKPQKIQFLQTYRATRDNGWLTPPQQ